jgi:hypothetical protein
MSPDKRRALVRQVSASIDYSIEDALEIAGDLLEDVNAHPEAAAVRELLRPEVENHAPPDLILERPTESELRAERQQREQRAEIQKRISSRLHGSAGDMTMALFPDMALDHENALFTQQPKRKDK